MTLLDADFLPDFLRDLLDRELNEDHYTGWSTQGFGMARYYVATKDVRINVWHSALAAPGLTPETGMVHTHPWDFTSRVIVGELRNTRYQVAESLRGGPWWEAEITPGPGGDFTGADGRAVAPSGNSTRRPVTLMTQHLEVYGPGACYSQTADEIHHTAFVDGTVTINRRRRGDRADRAFTYWKGDEQWVSAEPRTVAVENDCELALQAAKELLG